MKGQLFLNLKNIPLILLQLNSKLLSFINISLKSGENKTFAQFPAHYIENLPCKVDTKFIGPASEIVNKIGNFINGDLVAHEVEKEIDQLVYQHYSLTDEEIEIVESSFSR